MGTTALALAAFLVSNPDFLVLDEEPNVLSEKKSESENLIESTDKLETHDSKPSTSLALSAGFLNSSHLKESSDLTENISPNSTIYKVLAAENMGLKFLLDSEDALIDPMNRISSSFDIPEALQPRVKFWFNIYTKFTAYNHVIHHIRHPWIIYEVVDITPFMSGVGPTWLKKTRGLKYVEKRKREILLALRSLSRNKSLRNLTPLQKSLYEKLLQIPGQRSKVLTLAADSLRIQLGQRDFFLKGLESSSKYLPYIEEEFARRGLPKELTRIPFVESSYNEDAQSKVGASGIWQIMPSVGKHYSIVNDHIDERNSPLKATRIAAEIFKNYYQFFKSWPLAITAYNNGIGNLQKAMRKAGSKDLGEIIARYHQGSFQFASSNFYSGFLAAMHAEIYHKEIFEHIPLDKTPLLIKDSVLLTRYMPIKKITRLAQIDINTLVAYNLDLKKALKKSIILPRGYKLFLPPDSLTEFIKNTGVRKSADKETPSTKKRS